MATYGTDKGKSAREKKHAHAYTSQCQERERAEVTGVTHSPIPIFEKRKEPS